MKGINLTDEELRHVKEICVQWNAQAIIIDGVKYINLPLNKWKIMLDSNT